MPASGELRRSLVETLWYGQDPLAGYPAQPPDLQGWNSAHTYLTEVIERLRPDIVVEVGVWKGASVATMAQRMREVGCPGVVIAVDTFLGSADLWLDTAVMRQVQRVHGYPLLYYTFLGNIAALGLQDFVLPLPLDSANAAEVLKARGIRPAVLHIDAGHDYESVMSDLTRWWPLLRPGGVLIADDYDAAGVVWPTVAHAVDDFRARMPHTGFEALPYKCRFSKPAA